MRVNYPFFGGDEAEGTGDESEEAEGIRKKILKSKRGLSRRIWYNAIAPTTISNLMS